MGGASREKPVDITHLFFLKLLDKVPSQKLLKRKVSPEDYVNFCWRNKDGEKKNGTALAGKL